MNELELIARLTRGLPQNPSVIVGPGDDCAVLDVGLPEKWLLFKTDAIVEGIHFLSTDPPEKIGHKALGRCLSDIAAMAGSPTSALITLGLPAGFDSTRVEGIYEGLSVLARRFGVAIAGGETTASPGAFFISISLLGDVPRKKALLRSGAKAGDAIFVTGELGGSIAGKHLEFEPRIATAQWLAAEFSIHAMIDLSDGLGTDLPHVLAASGVGAELLASAIPVSRAARLRSRSSSNKPPLLAALTDGEDFELLFTVAPGDAVPLLDAWKLRFPDLPLSCIGKIRSEPGLQIRDETGVREFKGQGYVHFA